ncbi:YjbH domain-containing protein [Oceanomicrobium pacificus]|uniref:YjbH domain-containing protein n=1 Tax=Oceanomicrobium pacificus TaxID=2692916 RepID=A0A6B0TU14_9RHOB|nr:YjbH domain-containing protein [Oceanomicrobium pacificus]MXU65138.1 YjbH domain-containing protein [Oceanomicrobium pacificus]
MRNLYGNSGIIDMPSAEVQPDAEIAVSFSGFEGYRRSTLSFQILPRIEGALRYAVLPGFGADGSALYDRSMDLKFQLLREGPNQPAVALGFRDLLGTGVGSGEYLVATKHLRPDLAVSAGIGWGRLGSANGFANPFAHLSPGWDERPAGATTGGTFNTGQYFKGETAALFGGVTWDTPVRGLRLMAELSSDAYAPEGRNGGFTPDHPVNFGLDYQPSNGINFGLYALYGRAVAARLSLSANPRRSLSTGAGPAPVPVRARGDPNGPPAAGPGTNATALWAASIAALSTALAEEALELDGIGLSGDTAEIRVVNRSYTLISQAYGRALRAAQNSLPAEIGKIVVTMMEGGVPVSSLSVPRADFERIAGTPEAEAKLADAVTLTDAAPDPPGLIQMPERLPRFRWSVAPVLAINAFDPDNPVRADLGLQAEGQAVLAHGFSVSGAVTKKLVGNLDQITRQSDSSLPRVRSDIALYLREGDPAINRLTADYLFKPSPQLYGRLSAGYLERMFAGVSAELLWKPVNSGIGLGLELNYVGQRAFDQLFGLRDYRVATGHASLYWDTGWQQVEAQLDIGRYLAGDWGGTLTLSRHFANGWRVGAFATLTDVPFDAYGEGSFDKGILLEIPLSWASNLRTRKRYDGVIKPLARDGGARLNVENRLYPLVQDAHAGQLRANWASVWR